MPELRVRDVTYMSPEAYLAWEDMQTERHEFAAGQVFPMPEVSDTQMKLCANFDNALRSHFRNAPRCVFVCTAKVHVPQYNAYYYPDLVVSRESIKHEKDFGCVVSRPVLIAEVFSEESEQIDRREKLMAYRSIPSLQDYLTINEAKRQIGVYTRVGIDWQREIYEGNASVVLTSIGFTLSLDALYQGVM